ENPHQQAAFYRTGEPRFGVATARQAQGKQLSYNNINDTDAAYECVAEFDPGRTAACAIIKHANPCGVAEGATLFDAYRKALACDPVSAFGGIVALNRALDAEAARAITEIFTEVIIAPDATDEAIRIVGAKKNLRLLLAGGLPDPRAQGLLVKSVAGGLLVSTRDNAVVDDMDLKVVTRRAPSNAERRDLACVPRRQARQVEHHRLCQGQRHRRHRRRPDEPHRFGAHRGAQGRGCGEGSRGGGAGHQGLGGRLRRVLPVRRRLAGRDRGRRHGGDPARRLGARRRGDQGRRRPWHRHGVHRHKAFPALAQPPRRATVSVAGIKPPRRSGTRPERTPPCAPPLDRSLLAASLGSLRTAPAAGTARRRDPGTTALSLRGAPGRTPAATQAGRIASSRRDSEPRPRY